jgi:propionyl-CoA synthetase
MAAPLRRQRGSPGLATAGYRLELRDEHSGASCAPGSKGLLMAAGVLPPGCLTTLWQRDEQFVRTYWSQLPEQAELSSPSGQWRYATFDLAVADARAICGCSGAPTMSSTWRQALGTREVEESCWPMMPWPRSPSSAYRIPARTGTGGGGGAAS